jgi:pyruvate,orthophosphate dikinase
METKYIYFFGGGIADGKAELKDILGGKGANLAEMSRMGIPVPPGFTITSEVCNFYFHNDKSYPKELKHQVAENLARIEKLMGAKFGDEENPLLLSVRSGARISMPGMLKTILNLGLNENTVHGLARNTNNERFAYDSHRRFVQIYANVVLGVEWEVLEKFLERKKQEKGFHLDTELTTEDLKDIIKEIKNKTKEVRGKECPSNPYVQLWGAISAIFESWHNPAAIAYREANDIPHEWGTAVNIQAMVFGNMGDRSGAGVVFSRDPSTGERKLFGEFMRNAQGEDIVAGIRTPQPIGDLAEFMPQCYEELSDISQRLERHFKDLQDIEFTIQDGKLWVLQTRAGKRTAQASVKAAIDMVREKLISGKEALCYITPADIEQLLHPTLDPTAEKEVIATGLPASPGVASGKIIFDPEELAQLTREDSSNFILVRNETSADDFPGISVAAGVLTARGGITSHAAVVARGMGKSCIVGATAINIDQGREEFIVGNKVFRKGDYITLDGAKGEVIAGKLPIIASKPSRDLEELLVWTDLAKRLKVMANADNPQDVKRAREFGAEGVGLCRTEHMFFQADRIYYFRRAILAEDSRAREKALEKLLPMQQMDFLAIFEEMEGLPITVRLLDPPLHEFLPLPYAAEDLKALSKRLGTPFGKLREKVGELQESNPMLGHRGCRLGITSPEIYQMQVRAIMEAACELSKKGFRVFPEIMLPLIGHIEELKFFRDLVVNTCEKVRGEMKAEGLSYQIGIMIELPRAALIADELAKFADFFSFGTNDLTQMALGISRDDDGTFMPSYLKKEIFRLDPFISLDEQGVGELIKIAVERGRKTKPDLKIGVCGEHGGDPKSIEFFHKLGLDYVSCSPYRVPVARLAAAKVAVNATGLSFKS